MNAAPDLVPASRAASLLDAALQQVTNLGLAFFRLSRSSWNAAGKPDVWGDGFVEDDLRSMAAVRSWAELHPDEYVRLFPSLVPSSPILDLQLRQYLRDVLQGRDASASLAIRRHSDAQAWLDKPVATAFVHDEQTAAPNFDRASAIAFAFHTGVHPAYVWPEALIEHEMLTAAGWLGVIARGRPALIPREVALYLEHELVQDPLGRWSLKDLVLAGQVSGQIDLAALAACNKVSLRDGVIGLYRPRRKRAQRPNGLVFDLAGAGRRG